MERRRTIGSLELTTHQVQKAAERLTQEEEHVVRMRQGIPAARDAKLPRAAAGNEALEEELLLIELQLLRARMRAGKVEGLPRLAAPRAKTPTEPSRAKAKIVRALRRKA